MNNIQAKIGDFVKPDQWPIGSQLIEGTTYWDDSFNGCCFYLPTNNGVTEKLACNIVITGKPRYNWYNYKCRCRIEFVRDGEPSTFTRGDLFRDKF